MKRIAVLVTSSILLAACGNKTDANEKNFGAALSQYLDKKGDLCLQLKDWPVEVSEMDLRLQETMPTGTAGQMAALKAVGLVSGVDVERDEMYPFGNKPTGRKFTVKRYTLTEIGKKFYREAEVDSFMGTKKAMQLCYGKTALDEVVKWEGPMKFGDFQTVSVKYTYKIDNLAEWANKPEFQVAFPYVKNEIDGIGTKEEQHSLKLTNLGWEANGLD